VRRVDLLPAEADHPRAQAAYWRLALGPLEKRPQPIYCQRRRPVVFIPTVWAKFQAAREVNDLFNQSPLEDRLWDAFKGQGVAAERQWFLGRGRHRFCLDFALFCPQRNIDVECDGDAWHANPASARRDNDRNNFLEQRGWHVLRFTSAQLTRELPACVQQITGTIRRCGGLCLPDGTVRPIGGSRTVIRPAPAPVAEPRRESGVGAVDLGPLLLLARKAERRAALDGLRARHGTEAVARRLARALEDLVPQVRERAVWCLGELGPHPVVCEALAACLGREARADVRRLAYAACAKVRAAELEEAILKRLEKEEGWVLQYALKALARFGSARALGPIRRVLDKGQPANVVRAAEAAQRACQRWW
jgi:very-short-patch-repair endonuclease